MTEHDSQCRPDAVDYESHARSLQSKATDAWKNADPEFLSQARKLGIGPSVDTDLERVENAALFTREHELDVETKAAPGSFVDELDSEMDILIEEVGPEHAKLVMEVVHRLHGPLIRRLDLGRMQMISTIVCILVHCETANLRARIHQLLHSIPRLAVINGFSSMNKSAEACGVSREWIRRGRDEWCERLGIPVPEEGKKAGCNRKKLKLAAKILRAKDGGGGVATVQGVKAEFALWSRRVGGVRGVVEMGKRAASDVLNTLRPMASFYDEVRRSIVEA